MMRALRIAVLLTLASALACARKSSNGSVLEAGPADGMLPSSCIAAPSEATGSLFGLFAASAGDVNADGFDDIIVGAPNLDDDEETGSAFVFLGGPQGAQTESVTRIQPTAVGGMPDFGWSATGVGDVDADGFDDVAVGARNANTVYLYGGSAAGIALSSERILRPADSATRSFGSAVAPAGDVNADGYDDILVGAALTDVSTGTGDMEFAVGSVHLFFGGGEYDGALAEQAIPRPPGAVAGGLFGISVDSAGDVDADGYADVVVTGVGSDAWVYPGGAAGLQPERAVALVAGGSTGGSPSLGAPVSYVGDIDGDGFSDVAARALTWNEVTASPTVHLFNGTAQATSPVSVLQVPAAAPDADQGSGSYIAGGDLNGDGAPDLVVTGWGDEGETLVLWNTDANYDVGNATAVLRSASDGTSIGSSPSIRADIDGDGLRDLVIGGDREVCIFLGKTFDDQ